MEVYKPSAKRIPGAVAASVVIKMASSMLRKSAGLRAEHLGSVDELREYAQRRPLLAGWLPTEAPVTFEPSGASQQLSSVPVELLLVLAEQLHNLILKSQTLCQVPDEIGQLQNLSRLDLNHNQLTEIPDSIGSLHKLQDLDLSFNGLESVPASLGTLKQIRQACRSPQNASFEKLLHLTAYGTCKCTSGTAFIMSQQSQKIWICIGQAVCLMPNAMQPGTHAMHACMTARLD